MIAAPWYAEFGWECALWVPWLRGVSKRHVTTEMTVICKPGHEGLYEDFAHEVLVAKPAKITRVDCQDAWIDGVRLRHEDYGFIVEGLTGKKPKKGELVSPLSMPVVWGDCPRGRDAVHHLYNEGSKRDGPPVFHARYCETKQPERNWPEPKWVALAARLGNCVSIGSMEDAYHVPGTDDGRGMPLKETLKVIAEAPYVVGPSSGPLALAMQCGTPAVWWSPNAKDVPRFAEVWNPHGSRQYRVAESWNPSVDAVEDACLRFS